MSQPDDALQRFLCQFEVGTSDIDDQAPFSNTDNRSIAPEGTRSCPLCQSRMATQIHSGVKIDVCATHGVWLDNGELDVLCEQMDLVRERRHRAEVKTAYDRGYAAARRHRASW